ncbi:hypothetical protein EON81_27380 [bacterium]|nr:MAG: hypothetical protein EON81_27380 [bacterium]
MARKGATIGIWAAIGAWALLFGGCYLIERPPNLRPLRVGMTVAELAKARPGEYQVDPTFDECPKATTLTRDERHRFIGEIAFRLPDGLTETLSFAGGVCYGSSGGPRPVSKISRLVPDGITLGVALDRLPGSVDARIASGLEPKRKLPEEALRLIHYNGRLSGNVSWGWGMNWIWWDLEMRDGCIVKIEEKQYED